MAKPILLNNHNAQPFEISQSQNLSESSCRIPSFKSYTVPVLNYVIVNNNNNPSQWNFPGKHFIPKKVWDLPFKWAQQKASFTYVVVCIFAGLCNLFWKLPPPPPTPQGEGGMWRALIGLQSSTWEASQSTLTIADLSTTQKEPQFSSINDWKVDDLLYRKKKLVERDIMIGYYLQKSCGTTICSNWQEVRSKLQKVWVGTAGVGGWGLLLYCSMCSWGEGLSGGGGVLWEPKASLIDIMSRVAQVSQKQKV